MNEAQKEQFQSTIDVGLQVLKTSILINGGAAIALLTFMGNKHELVNLATLITALKCFATGVFISALGGFSCYAAQRLHLYCISKNLKSRWPGIIAGNVGVLLVFLSLCLFALGIKEASFSFKT
ncbi:hypothetical protein [Gilvimarinus agarilyticus]|uniref:hypothetical protein n=1 Tax=Gilvimarinus agarilyticus TaxID=679259 RepID=UPI0012F962A3|nr:hypothetical protein [Gilvimarinus agarilyticus]